METAMMVMGLLVVVSLMVGIIVKGIYDIVYERLHKEEIEAERKEKYEHMCRLARQHAKDLYDEARARA